MKKKASSGTAPNKDQIISELQQKIENLKSKGKDYNKLQSQLIDLEQRFKLALDEKNRSQREYREKHDLLKVKHDELEKEHSALIESKQVETINIEKIEKEIKLHSNISETRIAEIQLLKNQLTNIAEINNKLIKEKTYIQQEIELETETKEVSHREVDRLMNLSKTLSRKRDEMLAEEEIEISRIFTLKGSIDSD